MEIIHATRPLPKSGMFGVVRPCKRIHDLLQFCRYNAPDYMHINFAVPMGDGVAHSDEAMPIVAVVCLVEVWKLLTNFGEIFTHFL